ncbi:MAG: hypothetical protein COB41_00390 [Proteobacteria bacterium]|nr:MAG: hypothetical protein COB41_00390 [Pseudomonadota bacterium]
MANVFKRFVKGILLRGNTSDPTDNQEGSLWSNSTSNRLKSYIESAVRTLVSEDQSQTLTNKSMDGDDNTFSDIGITSLKTELADADKFVERDATGALVSGKAVPTGSVVGDTDTQTLTNKTIDATSASGSNTLSADASDIVYDNSASSLTATDTQAAVDEVEGRIDTIETNKIDGPGTHLDNAVPRFDGVNSNDVQTSGIIVDDSDNITGVNDLVVGGDLTVNGTTTTINTTNLDVTDANITVNNNGNDISSEGAGLTVERSSTDGSIVYEDALTSKFKIGALGSEVEVVDVSSSQTITNKDMSDATNNIDTASANGFTRLGGNQNQVLIPDHTSVDSIVLQTIPQVITNKDIDGETASNANRITLPKGDTSTLGALTRKEATLLYDTDLETLVYDDGTKLNQITSGDSSLNYVKNPGAETDTSDHTLYDDGAVSEPVDGTGAAGASLNLTRTVLASDILRGIASFAMVKNASNGQGEGVHVGLETIDPVDKGKRLQASFNYSMKNPGSNNYVNGDFKVFVYDVDNSVLLGAIENDDDGDILRHEGDGATFIGFFNATDSLNYRLLIHVASTNALSSLMIYDSVDLRPEEFVGTTYQRTEIINLAGSGDFTGGSLSISRVGNIVTVTGVTDPTFASSSNVNSVSGLIPDWALPTVGVINLPTMSVSSVTYMFIHADGALTFQFRNWAGTLSSQTSTTNLVGLSYAVEDLTNIVSNTKLTQQTIIARYTAASSAAVPNAPAVFDFSTKDIDTHNAVTTGASWQFKAPRTGYYSVNSVLHTNSANINSVSMVVRVEGASHAQDDSSRQVAANSTLNQDINTIVYMEKNHILDILHSESVNGDTYNFPTTGQYIEVKSLPDFTSYGVANPNVEYLEVLNSGQHDVTGNSGTWYLPTAAITLPLSTGTWDLELRNYISFYTTVGRGTVEVALSTSTTPGTDIFYSELINGNGNDVEKSWQKSRLTCKRHIVTSPENVYIHIRGLNFSGYTTASLLSLRGDFGTYPGIRLSAERVK